MKYLMRPTFWIPWFALAIVSYFYIDLPLTIYLHHLNMTYSLVGHIFNPITQLGYGGPYVTTGIIVLLWAYFVEKSQRWSYIGCYFLLSLLVAGLLCDYLKIIAGRARPNEYFSHHLYGFYFWQFHNTFMSFPSGHATNAAALATTGYMLAKRFGWFFLIFFILIAFSRLILEAHYLSDVMAGGYLGFIISYSLYPFFANRMVSETNLISSKL